MLTEGVYGEIYEKNGKILKVSKENFDDLLTSEIREASFLKSYQFSGTSLENGHFPFIPKIHSIRENNNKIEIEMEKVGKSIKDIFSDTTDRVSLCIKIFPVLIPKMLNILSILERSHIIHGDLSDGNITLSEDRHSGQQSWSVHLIDWGAVILDMKNTSLERGCTNYCKAPELFDKNFYAKVTSNIGKMTAKSDLYSFGKVLMWMISDGIRECVRGRGYRFKRGEMKSIRKISKVVGYLYPLLNSILLNNPKIRPSATQLLKRYTIPTYYKEFLYLKSDPLGVIYPDPSSTIKCRTEDICWALEIEHVFNSAYFYVKKSLHKKSSFTIDVIISSCVLLADMMCDSIFNSYEEFLDMLINVDETIKYTSDDIKNCLKDIVVNLFEFDMRIPKYLEDEGSMVVFV